MSRLPFPALLAAGLLAAPGHPRAEPAHASRAAAADASDELAAPPGASADRALWATTAEAQASAVSQRLLTSRLLHRARTMRYAERLDELSRAAPDRGAETRDLLGRLARASQTARGAAERTPFHLGTGCRRELLALESAMAARGPTREADLEDARRAARECRDVLLGWLRPVEEGNRALLAVSDEVDRALPAPSAATPSPSAPSAPSAGPLSNPAAAARR